MSTAAEIARALKAKRCGHSWIARCPAHDDSNPSFSIAEGEEGRALFKCHAGCTQANVIAALRQRGLWGGENVEPFIPRSAITPKRFDERDAYNDALKIWDNANPAKGTRVEDYLRARGIRVPPPYWTELRYAPRLRHSPTKQTFPAMIARLSDNRGFVAIQRTYLDPALPRKADIMPSKMTKGTMRGSAVRFGAPDEMLGIAEGVETALSARQLYSLPVWAVLSCVRIKQIEIPPSVKSISVFADQDKAGRAEAFEAAEMYDAKGYHAEVIMPASDFEATERGDFNSILQDGTARRYE